ncbi:hypothetical protein LCGC14_1930100, partial [marine sediment metagenome]
MRNPGRHDEESCGRFGGKLEDMPQPIRRLFPKARRKRVVTIRFTHYAGIGKHVYASVEEEDNPVWDGECWTKPWQDPDGNGQSFGQQFVGGGDMNVAYNDAAK